MGWYTELHERVKAELAAELRAAGHIVRSEFRTDGCIFDVWDATTKTAYEVLTAKIVRSSHERDEAIIAKLFRYVLHCRALVFVVASYGEEDIELFHHLGMGHWHRKYSWSGQLESKSWHAGATPLNIAKRIYRALTALAPLTEWTAGKRRRRHKYPLPPALARATKKYGLPPHFMQGLWRDWHLQWVLQLERLLPKWKKVLERRHLKAARA
ncbi:MAG: hypothetical protein QXG98_02910 [Candidatus Micrarchaeia archaeon]